VVGVTKVEVMTEAAARVVEVQAGAAKAAAATVAGV